MNMDCMDVSSSSWRHAALSAIVLAANAAVAPGQRVIVIPNTLIARRASVGVPVWGEGGEGEEPPCRQRRLEPWRRVVRQQCAAHVADSCPRTEDGSPFVPGPRFQAMFASPVPEPRLPDIDTLFRDVFSETAPRPHPGIPLEDAEGLEPLDGILKSMLDFSIRAFDDVMKATLDGPVAGAGPEGSEEVGGGLQAPSATVAESSSDDRGGSEVDDVAMESSLEAAESSLDAMVATLARSAASQSADSEEDKDGELTNGLAGDFLDIIPPLGDLRERLSRMGGELLAEASRRRLSEEGDALSADGVRLRVRERLARRLTEYRRDLFFYPDGTVTLYTTAGSALPPSSVFVAPRPSGGGPYVLPLGLGSYAADECIRERYESGALGEGGCSLALEDLLAAVEDRTKVAPSLVLMGERGLMQQPIEHLPQRGLPELHLPIGMFILFIITVTALLVSLVDFFQDDEEEDCNYTSEEGEVQEFGYGRLPEEEGHRVFMGVPVQIV